MHIANPFVDVKRCISCGFCISVCPEVFRFGNDSKSEVYNPTGVEDVAIQVAVDGCPSQCISWRLN